MEPTDHLSQAAQAAESTALVKYAWAPSELFQSLMGVPEGPVPDGGWSPVLEAEATHLKNEAALGRKAVSQYKVPWYRSGWVEVPKSMLIGDPLDAINQIRGGGRYVDPMTGRSPGFWRSTFLPGHGWKQITGFGALNFGAPAAMTAWQYFSTPESERKNTRGRLIGGAAGGFLGGSIGGRLGMLGGNLLGAVGQRAGEAVGGLFDPKHREYPVKPVLAPETQAALRYGLPAAHAVMNQAQPPAGGPAST